MVLFMVAVGCYITMSLFGLCFYPEPTRIILLVTISLGVIYFIIQTVRTKSQNKGKDIQ